LTAVTAALELLLDPAEHEANVAALSTTSATSGVLPARR